LKLQKPPSSSSMTKKKKIQTRSAREGKKSESPAKVSVTLLHGLRSEARQFPQGGGVRRDYEACQPGRLYHKFPSESGQVQS